MEETETIVEVRRKELSSKKIQTSKMTKNISKSKISDGQSFEENFVSTTPCKLNVKESEIDFGCTVCKILGTEGFNAKICLKVFVLKVHHRNIWMLNWARNSHYLTCSSTNVRIFATDETKG